MASKDKGKKETKKPAKLQPKVAPGRKREDFSQAVSRIVKEPAGK